ncbi:MAG TPA: hypothetical protein VGD26_05245 [Chitinophagaceae bacterium]
MTDFEIDLTRIEELQMIGNVHELDNIFQKAYIAITGGRKVILYRRMATSQKQKIEELDTEDALKDYKDRVYKYL